MGGEGSRALYSQVLLLAGRLVHLLQVVAGLVKGYREDRVHTGVFGADMKVHLERRKAWLLREAIPRKSCLLLDISQKWP